MMRERDELRRIAHIAISTAFVVIAAFVAGKAARDAVLLRYFAIQWLPVFAGATAALSLPVVIFAGRAIARWGPERVLPWLNFASALLLAGEWWLLGRAPRPTAVLVFLHLGSLGAVLVSGFWSVISERFDIQSAKQYVGRIGLGATIGGIAGGVVAERCAVYLEPDAILLVLAGLQLVCAVMLRLRARDELPRAEVAAQPAAKPLAALQTVVSTPLLRNLACVVVLGAIGAAALDYVFKAGVTEATHGGLLRVFALYQIATSVLTAVFQVAFAKVALTKFGAPRSISTLPLTVAGFGLTSILFPGLGATMVSRGAENVVRSSIYRAGYELLFAPLPEQDKRPTKVLLDVGAERLGDLAGAQLVAALVYLLPAPRTAILVVAGMAGLVGFAFAALIPRAYTRALERSLVARGGEPQPDRSVLWSQLGMPTMSDAGADRTTLSLVDLAAPPAAVAAVVDGEASAQVRKRTRKRPKIARPPDPALAAIESLRSRDKARIAPLLEAGIGRELVAHALPLIAWDEVAPDAIAALSKAAPHATGTLLDALLDPATDFTIRRRLPAILVAGDPDLAPLGLWRGLDDPRFEVRYRCGRALGQLRAAGHDVPVSDMDIYKRIIRELSVEAERLRAYRLLDPELGFGATEEAPRALAAVSHAFNLLTLVLSPAAVQIAFDGMHGTDRVLRATAMEYLESALPDNVTKKLWPLISGA